MNNFIFVFSLFAIFLTVNAVPFQLNKRATTFNPCSNNDPLTVAMQPDPPVSNENTQFTASGKLTNDITSNKTIFGIQSPFSISVSDVSIPTLPDSYLIVVVVGDPTGNQNNPLNVYGCAFANVSSADNSF
ncbi:25414_t:CDS:2, partial [Dentiscutata erythropus]